MHFKLFFKNSFKPAIKIILLIIFLKGCYLAFYRFSGQNGELLPMVLFLSYVLTIFVFYDRIGEIGEINLGKDKMNIKFMESKLIEAPRKEVEYEKYFEKKYKTNIKLKKYKG